MSRSTTAEHHPSRSRLRRQTHELRRAIDEMGYVASGHIHLRTIVCGSDRCRCARDPEARHGPYYQWSRRLHGRQVNKALTAEQARLLEGAIANRRRILELLAEWERETAAEILQLDEVRDG